MFLGRIYTYDFFRGKIIANNNIIISLSTYKIFLCGLAKASISGRSAKMGRGGCGVGWGAPPPPKKNLKGHCQPRKIKNIFDVKV